MTLLGTGEDARHAPQRFHVSLPRSITEPLCLDSTQRDIPGIGSGGRDVTRGTTSQQVCRDVMSRNIWIFVTLGVFFWFADALFIRFTGVELFHFGSNWLIGLFLATPFAGWVLIKTCLAVTGIPEQEALSPITILCSTGLLLNGIAISQYRWLYGDTLEHVLLGAAWLLWGVGVLLILAIYFATRSGNRSELSSNETRSTP